MSKPKLKMVEFCGTFEGKAKLREGETKEQFAGRVERAMLAVLDRYASRLNVNVGVDYGDLRDVD